MNNLLDKLIAWFSPVRGLRRAYARRQHELMRYEAASAGRRTYGWNAPHTGPNAELAQAKATLRARSRDLVRNSPWARRAVQAIVANAVGTGIVARTPDRRLAEIWERWTRQCDAAGVLDFYGLQALVARTVVESGECFVRMRQRYPDDGIYPPFQLQVLEPDYLDISKNQVTDSGYIQHGIQYNGIGKRIGYWLFEQHPGEALPWGLNRQSKFVPAEDVLHVYRPDRPGQDHGEPWLAPVMLRIRDLDDYEYAELIRKKIEACIAAVVTTASPERTVGPMTDANGRKLETFEPGMIGYLPAGDDVRFLAPPVTSGYGEYVRHQLHAIAAGIGVPYELLTGDLSQVNYSSIRAGLLEFRRAIEQFRWHVLVPQLCEPVWRRFCLLAKVSAEPAPVTWTPPAFETVDPLKEAQAYQVLIRSGLVTWREAVSAYGYDPDQQLDEIAATNAAWDAAGVVFDCDPRKVTQSGAVQKEF